MNTRSSPLGEEFQEFLMAPEVCPSLDLRARVIDHIHRELNPSPLSVFLKMLGIHAVISIFSLSICSQFGMQPFKVYDAMESMMTLVGETYCMGFCGLLYLSVSALALSLLLKPEEIRVIRRQRVLQLTLLASVSLGVFLCFGAEVLFMPGLLWVVGSLTGGLFSFELGWMLRVKLST